MGIDDNIYLLHMNGALQRRHSQTCKPFQPNSNRVAPDRSKGGIQEKKQAFVHEIRRDETKIFFMHILSSLMAFSQMRK